MSVPRSIAFLYGREAVRALTTDDVVALVRAYDRIVIERHALEIMIQRADLWPHIRGRTLLYSNSLGAAYYRATDLLPAGFWPGPGDVAQKAIRTERGVYCYRIDEGHPMIMGRAAFALCGGDKAIGGIFVDDHHREGKPNYWRFATQEERASVWDRTDNWTGIFDDIEAAVRNFAALRGCETLFNGPTQRAPRLYESVGTWIALHEVEATCKAGDAMLVRGIDANGRWGNVHEPYGGYPVGATFEQVFREARDFAEDHDMMIGLAYIAGPAGGGSACSPHPFFNPQAWEVI